MNKYVTAAIAASLIALGWVTRSWYEDSLSLAVNAGAKAAGEASAAQIAAIKVENKTIYAKTVEKITTDIQYLECKQDDEMLKLTNQALTGK